MYIYIHIYVYVCIYVYVSPPPWSTEHMSPLQKHNPQDTWAGIFMLCKKYIFKVNDVVLKKYFKRDTKGYYRSIKGMLKVE